MRPEARPLPPLLSTLALPAAFAGLVAMFATVAVERLGGRRGGLLATVPSTIVAYALGSFAASADTATFAASMAAVPAGMLVDAAFLWTWRVLPRRLPPWSFGVRLAATAGAALAVWALAAAALLTGMGALWRRGVPPMASGTVCLVMLAAIGVASCWRPPPSPRGGRPVSVRALVVRGALAATAVGVSLLVTRAGAPLVGGLASVFPAIFLTTMVSLWWAQGEAVSLGAVGPIVLGSTSVGAFALIAAWTLPAWGPWVGVPAAWILAVATTTLPARAWLDRRPS